MKTIKSIISLAALLSVPAIATAQTFKLNDLEYFEERGANVLVYSNIYNGGFCDEKLAGIEIIQRGERISTGGGIRFMNTPEQWDIYGTMTNRTVNRKENYIEVELTYEDYGFTSKIRVQPKDKGCLMQVYLDKPVPENLVGKAGMNLEFFPASYFGKNYLVDGVARILPKYPQHDTQVRPVSEKIPQYYGESTFDDRGRGEFLVPIALSTGHQIVMAPEDKTLRVGIRSDREVSLYDGRLLAQNGTFVVRSLLPEGKTGKVLEWYVEPSVDQQWTREPNIGFSQIGYTPAQKKVAVVELDRNDKPAATAKILRVNPDGVKSVAMEAKVEPWGVFYNRYNYVTIDFSQIKEPGLYSIEYAGVETNAFPIDKDVYSDKWHASMDISLVVNMDHMEVNEAYRIWHGRANMDDAVQAPLNIRLHDGYSMGDTTNTKYKPLEHIPGLAVGGWYDAGDFDIQANSVVNTVQDLASLWRLFKPLRDQTFIDEKTQYADIHRPDGIPDVVQQIMHGTLNINAQVENIGFVANVIGQPDMHHYHHLGDAMTLSDGLIYDPSLKLYEVKDGRSGTPDDRFVVTSRGGAGSAMGTIVSLASAYPALKEYFPEEAERSLKNALKLWDQYAAQLAPRANQNQAPAQGQGMWNRRGGGDPRLNAAIELYYATGEQRFKDVFMPIIMNQLNPRAANQQSFGGGIAPNFNLASILRVYDMLDGESQQKVKDAIPAYVENLSRAGNDNPYKVPIQGSNWAGNTQVMGNAFNFYLIWRQFPDQVDPELVLKGLNYIYGCHPYSNVSFITAVGVNTKKVAYGNNRADYTVIPGGVVPGLIVKKPDLLENKDDYPFLWGENECCINSVPNYVMLNLACDEIAKSMNK
ncbi:MAG: glycoside hydrolase family 9 protein [Bacteroidaceae bacterium]|nr:glycoside hydrolase family 9 protein [Bacteroidaceae bacterium]